MPRTVEGAFREFVAQLAPSDAEANAAGNHRASIKRCLKRNCGLVRYVRIGSFGSGTSVYGYSDVDYLACLPATMFTRDSSAALKRVQRILDARFPMTGVRIRTPAVVVPFDNLEFGQTEVVPARYYRREYRYDVYEIADGAGGWMRTSPKAHRDYVRYVDRKKENKVRPLIRIVKAWKGICNVPISSFYLELRIARHAEGEQGISFCADLRNVLKELLAGGLASMQDPMGVSGLIPACVGRSKRIEALSKLGMAVLRADRAYGMYQKGRFAEAFDWLDSLFGYNFPKYHY